MNPAPSPTSTAVAKPETKKPTTIKALLEGEEFKLAVARALPRHLSADRFIRVALTALIRTPKLAECDRGSFFQALMTLSQLGIELDGRRAHLIPFDNRKRGIVECQLIVDYKGLVDLAMRSGAVSNIHADVVREADEFEYDRGVILHHRINFKEERGAVYAAYAICRFKDGGEKTDVMTRAEIEAVRARSRAKDNGPWVTDWAEMAKKTVFRRLSKWLPLSAEFRDALDADADSVEDHRVEVAKPIFDTPPAFLEAPSSKRIAPPPVSTPHEQAQPVVVEESTDEPIEPKTPTPTPTPAPVASDAPVVPAIVELEQILDENNIPFDTLQQWAVKSGSFPQFSSYASLGDVPERTAARLVKAKQGLIKALTADGL